MTTLPTPTGKVCHRCLFVSPDDISKSDAARVIILDIQMFHHESWKPIYFGV